MCWNFNEPASRASTKPNVGGLVEACIDNYFRHLAKKPIMLSYNSMQLASWPKVVTLIVFNHERDLKAFGPQVLDDLIWFMDVDPGIIGSLNHKQRFIDFVCIQCRWQLTHDFFLFRMFGVIPLCIHLFQIRLPVFREGIIKGKQVRQAHIVHAKGIQIRGLDQRTQSGQAAITGFLNGGFLCTNEVQRLGVGDTIFQVIEHVPSDLLADCQVKWFAVTTRTAVVDL